MMQNPFLAMPLRIEQRQRELEEHRKTCTADPCDTCGRFKCHRGCGTRVVREGSTCRPCWRKGKLAEWQRRAEQAIPQAFKAARLDAPWLVTLVGSKVIEDARDALASPRVAGVGPPGSGKTSLVAAMLAASDFAERDSWPCWTSAHQLAKARALHPLGDGEAPLIVQALSADVLVVDELGGEDQRYASAVSEVLYERHAEARVTWVTTGVSPKEIADRYGGGIARRVFEDAAVFRLQGRKR